jgi:hypothetical protein
LYQLHEQYPTVPVSSVIYNSNRNATQDNQDDNYYGNFACNMTLGGDFQENEIDGLLKIVELDIEKEITESW